VQLNKSYDVIVAGGGPVGLFLAAEVRRYGRSVLVIDRLTEPSAQIKAGSVGPRSAELFDQRGLADAFPPPDPAMFRAVAAGTSPGAPPPRPVGHFAGVWLLRGAPEIRTLPLFAPQQQVETVLNGYALEAGVTVLRGHEVTGFGETPTGVEVTAGGTVFTGRYLVGCDGGRSLVRKLGGFGFPGTPATITGRQALVEIAEPNPLTRGWHRTDRGMIVFGPGPHRVLTVEFDGPPADRTPITAEEIEASLRRVSGTEVTVTALITGTRWSDNTRQADTYRRGRILLAGDAAHVHPPFGGQGLNLGFQDAANLGWKLAATLAGDAPADLLDTYTTERHPVAAAALDNTRAQVALMRPDPQTGALRELFTQLLGYDEPNAHVSRLMTGVDRPYPIAGDHPETGHPVADRKLPEATGVARLYEVLRAPGGLLLDGTADGSLAALADGWTDRVTVLATPGDDSLLIRPDGIVAWGASTGDADPEAVRESLCHWFGSSRRS